MLFTLVQCSGELSKQVSINSGLREEDGDDDDETGDDDDDDGDERAAGGDSDGENDVTAFRDGHSLSGNNQIIS